MYENICMKMLLSDWWTKNLARLAASMKSRNLSDLSFKVEERKTMMCAISLELGHLCEAQKIPLLCLKTSQVSFQKCKYLHHFHSIPSVIWIRDDTLLIFSRQRTSSIIYSVIHKLWFLVSIFAQLHLLIFEHFAHFEDSAPFSRNLLSYVESDQRF